MFFKMIPNQDYMTRNFHICFFLSMIYSFTTLGQAQEKGYASYYGKEFHGRKTACGERYDMKVFTAAHRTLPFGTIVRVTHLGNSKCVIVKINDRGPFSKKRVVDVSRIAAEKLGLINEGVAMVMVDVLSGSADSLLKLNELDITYAYNGTAKDSIHVAKTAQIKWEIVKLNKIYNHNAEAQSPQGYGIQVLSISDVVKMRSEVDSLYKKGFGTIYIEPAFVGNKKSFRILVGDFKEKSLATNDKIKLESMGYNGFVKKYVTSVK